MHALLADGTAIREICRQLGLSRGTVRRFAQADGVEELLTRNGTGRRASVLDPFTPYLHQRWNEGCANATALFTEITARGYRGDQTLVRQYLSQFARSRVLPSRRASRPRSVASSAGSWPTRRT